MQIGQRISFGSYNWLVIDTQVDKVLIITESIVGQSSFHNRVGDVTWAESSLREYLNNDFLNSFTKEEQSKIISVLNKNENNQWYGSIGGIDTWDKIFLLSLEEVTAMYFGNSRMNLLNPSQKQKYWFQKKDLNNEKRRALLSGHVWWWWLRSPGRDNKRAAYIHGDGNVGIQGNGIFRYNSKFTHPTSGNNCGGYRPVLWLKIETREKKSKVGTLIL